MVGDFAETQEPLPDEISINVKTEEVGKGVNGILGLHLKPLDNLEIAAQWQLNTKMKLERTFELESDLNEDGYLNSTTAADADPYRIDAEVSRRIFPKDENRKDIPDHLDGREVRRDFGHRCRIWPELLSKRTSKVGPRRPRK